MDDPLEGAAHDADRSQVAGESAGAVIGRYTLVRSIGEGGMGTVWLAEQSHPVKRQVALKIVKLGMDTREVIVRFEAERQALALMDHPCIARVLDGGATDTGRPYFVMDLVHGSAITDFAEQAEIGVRGRLALFIRVCEAVQHAHQKGVIHRDIKPSNVLVALVDGEPTPKVIDFGIAKATSAELTQKTLFTQQAQLIGTPQYMAPEQADFSGIDIDTRADVYSLGVLLYELLTGTTPFDLHHALAGGYEELLRTIREVDPERPSTRVSTAWGAKGEGGDAADQDTGVDVGSRSRLLRGDLDWIVMKALEKDRARRYDSATAFAADIQRYLVGEPVLAHPQSRAYQLRKFVTRRKRAVALALSLTLALMLGTLGTTVGWYRTTHANKDLERASRAKDAALAGRDAALEQTELALAEKELERLAAVDARNTALELADFQHATIVNQLDAASMGRQIVSEFEERIDSQLRKQGAPDSEVEKALANFRGLTANIPLADLSVDVIADSILKKSAAAIARNYSDRPNIAAELHRSLAMAYRNIGETEEVVRHLRQALSLTSEGQGFQGRHYLYGHELADGLYAIGRLEEAASLLAPLLTESRVELGRTHRQTFELAGSLSTVFSKQDRRAESIELAEEVIADWRRAPHADGSVPFIILMNHAVNLSIVGRTDDAEAILIEAADLEEQGHWNSPEDSAAASLGFLRESQGRLDEAAVLYEKSIAAYSERYGSDRRTTIVAMNNLAFVYLKQGRTEKAESTMLEVVAAARRTLGDLHIDTGVFIHTLGETYLATGRLDQADGALRESLVIYERAGFMTHMGSLLTQLAQIAAAQGSNEESFALLERAAEFGISPSLLAESFFDNLRLDPRFRALTQR